MRARQEISEDYMHLIRRCALMPIHSRSQLKQAVAMVDELSDRLKDLSSAERAYFDVLCDLVKDYETKRHWKTEQLKPADALKYLMDANGLTLKDLVPIVRHKSHLSAFLNGKRGLSKANALRLAERFKVSPVLFLQEG